VKSGTMIDEAMIYWYARPSARYPTVEVRVSDVCPTVEDTALITALTRALVATMIDDIRAGRTAPPVRDCLLDAAHWHAAHEETSGNLIDLPSGVLRPAWYVIETLLAKVDPALRRHGDTHFVERQLSRLRAQGTGAARQQRLLRRTGDVRVVVELLAEQTTAGQAATLERARHRIEATTCVTSCGTLTPIKCWSPLHAGSVASEWPQQRPAVGSRCGPAARSSRCHCLLRELGIGGLPPTGVVLVATIAAAYAYRLRRGRRFLAADKPRSVVEGWHAVGTEFDAHEWRMLAQG
jgi:hypothetical protein